MGGSAFCAQCGGALVPGSRFCGKCGAALAVKRGGRVWKIAFLAAAGIAAAAVAWIVLVGREGPPPRKKCPAGKCPKVSRDGAILHVEGEPLLEKVELEIPRGVLDKDIEIEVSP